MRILIACEFSGIVRDAFIAKGHDAWSCDLLPSERPGNHIQDDVLKYIYDYLWDALIAFPPCPYLTVSANKHYKINPERYWLRLKAAEFFLKLALAPILKIAIENPIGVMSGFYRKPDQIIQPWMFGHGETKATCLWLKNLPELKPTNIVEGREGRVWKMTPSPERWKERSRTLSGIAEAMAEQWNF
jgi:hypothetical protein